MVILRLKCGNNIKMALKETECEDVDWIRLAPDLIQGLAVVKMVMKLRVPQKMRHVLTS
jgi:hypothetical protein